MGCRLKDHEIVSILGLARSPTRLAIFRPPDGEVSILGLARSPTRKPGIISPRRGRFQYLGSRGAQPWCSGCRLPGVRFQYLGSRGAQLRFPDVLQRRFCFNTWAREEPNCDLLRSEIQCLVSILGLARSPTLFRQPGAARRNVSILGLARSPTESFTARRNFYFGFNTWAREEPNSPVIPLAPTHIPFQYLGSRGAQRFQTSPASRR